MRLSRLTIAALCLTLAALAHPAPARAMEVSYLFTLSNFTGVVPFGDVVLNVDRTRDEAYAVLGNDVRVFNRTGMEVYRFEFDRSLGRIYALAVDEAGDILLLALDLSSRGPLPDWSIIRCDYRGAALERIRVSGLPPEFDGFVPNAMVYRDGSFVLASRAQLLVAEVDRGGRFQAGYNLAEALGIEEKHRLDTLLTGFDLDRQGNMIFTIATMFRAFVVSPGGEVKAFGRAGSVPGSFGVAADIAADEQGRYLVSDRLRRVVLVFDRDLKFITEFGDGKVGGRRLAHPGRLALGGNGTVYVTQSSPRGIAVFRLDSGGEVIRSEAGPQARGGADRGGTGDNEPGQSATETVSVDGPQTKPPVLPLVEGSTRIPGPADRRLTGIPGQQRGDRQ